MENLFFLALVAVVGLIRWFITAAENKKNAEAAKRAQPETSSPLPPTVSEEERIRRFMEALGVPKGAAPPPRKFTPRPQKKILPVDPFPTPQQHFPPFLPRPTSAAAPEAPAPPRLPLPTRDTSMPAPPKREPARTINYNVDENAERLMSDAPARAASASEAKRVEPPSGIAARLRTSEGLREAVILREILGPPRGMQPLNPAGMA